LGVYEQLHTLFDESAMKPDMLTLLHPVRTDRLISGSASYQSAKGVYAESTEGRMNGDFG
jgi:hypothetical protein